MNKIILSQTREIAGRIQPGREVPDIFKDVIFVKPEFEVKLVGRRVKPLAK